MESFGVGERHAHFDRRPREEGPAPQLAAAGRRPGRARSGARCWGACPTRWLASSRGHHLLHLFALERHRACVVPPSALRLGQRTPARTWLPGRSRVCGTRQAWRQVGQVSSCQNRCGPWPQEARGYRRTRDAHLAQRPRGLSASRGCSPARRPTAASAGPAGCRPRGGCAAPPLASPVSLRYDSHPSTPVLPTAAWRQRAVSRAVP